MAMAQLPSQQRRGLLFIISAPSGTGKTTLVRTLISRLTDIRVSVSHTTRPQRQGEVDGGDYYFIDEATFTAMVNDDRFLEHARVFDYAYGTARDSVEQQLAGGHDVILEIDWQGAQQVRRQMPEAISIFIAPPSYETLVQRLNLRAREDADTIARRLRGAVEELSHYSEYDYVIINDDLERAGAELATIVAAARLRLDCRRPALDTFIQSLIAQARQIQ